MPTPDYEFHVHDVRTLDEDQELRPESVLKAKWTRSAYGAGSFELQIPRMDLNLESAEDHHLIEVNRDEQIEFVGVIEKRTIDPLGKVWTLSGPDLTSWWLNLRVVGAVTGEDRSGIAEDVIVDYMDAHLGSIASAARQAQLALGGGLLFSIPTSSRRGASVTIAAQRRYLFDVVMEAAQQGDILPSIQLLSGYAGYAFQIDTPRDATLTGGGVPFSVDWNNVEALAFTEDFSQYKNHIYVMGDGSGDARNYTEVEDAASVATHFRREGVTDARDSTSAALREAVGTLELLKRNNALVAVQATPFRGAANSVYREDWDVGWYVTFSESALRTSSIDVQVAAASVELTRGQGERITFELGQQRATSQLRRIEEAIRQLRVASLA